MTDLRVQDDKKESGGSQGVKKLLEGHLAMTTCQSLVGSRVLQVCRAKRCNVEKGNINEE